MKGRYFYNRRFSLSDLTTATSYLNQAIVKDPDYALAYSGLSDVFGTLSSYGSTPSEYIPKSNAAARKALQLDPTLARPHASLGANMMEYDWDFAAGEAEYKKALELDPNDAIAHLWYASDLAIIGGREQQALAEINRAHELDPPSAAIGNGVGLIHISARRYDQAIKACKKVATENPTYAYAHDCLALAYWAKRMYPQVIEEWKIYGQLSGDQYDSEFAASLELGFSSSGWKGALTKGIEVRLTQRKTEYFPAYWLAVLYADLGDKNQAFRWLDNDLSGARLSYGGFEDGFPARPPALGPTIR